MRWGDSAWGGIEVGGGFCVGAELRWWGDRGFSLGVGSKWVGEDLAWGWDQGGGVLLGGRIEVTGFCMDGKIEV